jgi:XFP C-terminal domain
MLIHRLTYRRANHRNLHVRGYKEEGTTTTPFDMVMLNDLDRFHLVIDVVDRLPGLSQPAAHLRQQMEEERLRARAYTREHGTTLQRSPAGRGRTERRPRRQRRIGDTKLPTGRADSRPARAALIGPAAGWGTS